PRSPPRSTPLPYTTLFRSLFPSTYDPRGAAIKFDQRLAGREIPLVQLHRLLELLSRFFGKRHRGKPPCMVRLVSVCPAQPFVKKDRKSTRLNSSHVAISYA